MYYEEKMVDGVLYSIGTPDGEWKKSETIKANALQAIFALTDEERSDIFGYFCRYCGSKDTGCQCWNDE